MTNSIMKLVEFLKRLSAPVWVYWRCSACGVVSQCGGPKRQLAPKRCIACNSEEVLWQRVTPAQASVTPEGYAK